MNFFHDVKNRMKKLLYKIKWLNRTNERHAEECAAYRRMEIYMQDEKLELMKNARIPKALWKIGMPTMVGMLVASLYTLVDAYYVGGLGTSAVGAVSVSFPIGQIVIGLGALFGSGAASYIARLFGESNYEEANKTASTALFLSLAVGVILIMLALIFLDPLLIMLGATETILPYARKYASIYIAGSIFNFFTVTVSNTITAEGATRYSMIAQITGGVVNLILAPIMIYSLKWGIRGAAVATLISMAISFLLYARYIVLKVGTLRFHIKYVIFDKKIFKGILSVGIPVFVFQLLASMAIALTNTAASRYGDNAVAAMGIVTRILALGFGVIYGFLRGFQPIAGYNYGARKFDRLKEALRVSIRWTTWFSIISAVLLLLFAPQIMALFSQDKEVIMTGSYALRIGAIPFITYGFVLVYAMLFLALGKTIEGAIFTFSRQGVFFIPLILLLPRFLGIKGIMYAQPVADILTFVLCLFFSIKINKMLNNEVEE